MGVFNPFHLEMGYGLAARIAKKVFVAFFTLDAVKGGRLHATESLRMGYKSGDIGPVGSLHATKPTFYPQKKID